MSRNVRYKISRSLRLARASLVLFLFMTSLMLLSAAGVLPLPHQWAASLYDVFRAHAVTAWTLLIICGMSFGENFAPISAYLPFSVVMLTAMAATSGQLIHAIPVFLCIFFPSLLSHHANYFLAQWLQGKPHSGEHTPARSPLSGLRWWFTFLISLWHPQFASVTCWRAGSSSLHYRAFLPRLLVSSTIWNIFWGLLMYYSGESTSRFLRSEGALLVILAFCYVSFMLVKDLYRGFTKLDSHADRNPT